MPNEQPAFRILPVAAEPNDPGGWAVAQEIFPRKLAALQADLKHTPLPMDHHFPSIYVVFPEPLQEPQLYEVHLTQPSLAEAPHCRLHVLGCGADCSLGIFCCPLQPLNLGTFQILNCKPPE